MSGKVRAKFVCSSLTTTTYAYGTSTSVTLTPVAGTNDPQSENSKFWDATPNGQLVMHSTPERLAMFKPGKEYYLDVIPADEES